MNKLFSLLILSQISFCAFAQNNVLPAEVQIKLALLSAPAEKKDSAAVYGYSANKELVLLRKGTNELICLADDPNQPGLSVACYHKDLEPFMQRGRELRKLGKTFKEIFDTRENEVKAGKLQMPKQPSTLYVYSASKEEYNDTTGEVKKGYLRSVIYIPYATTKSTGLPLKPEAPGMPWMMNPGTHAAHIMINPPEQ
ncbi:hypothetical protein [Segetibacter koreensis]|uniref:hypothetical protein n=1 Tax=Segetibacter koreensis TaxID=398037 RepID=UPI00035DE659|nr:hypothetical protein [Segetibacter koreensis]